MLKNPLYFSLGTNPELTAKDPENLEKSFFLLPLKNRDAKPFIFKKNTYLLDEQHLSIYRKFSDKRDTLSPIHVTAKYYCATGAIIIHAYFDEFGNYLATRVNRDNAKKNIVTLSPEEELTIEKMIEESAAPKLKAVFSELLAAQNQAKTKKDLTLHDLEEESRNGTTSVTYRRLLRETISAVENHNNLEFYPSHSVRKFLQGHLYFLENAYPLEGATVSNPEPERSEDNTSSPEASPLLSESMAESTLETESLAEEKFQPTERLPADSFAARETELYRRLDACAANDLNMMLKITKELDEHTKLHREALVLACIEGNQKAVARHLHSKNTTLIPALLATCVYHNQPDLFAWLHKQNKCKFLFHIPYEQAKPLTLCQIKHYSFLEIAYKQKHPDFFMLLLHSYHESPDALTISGNPLLSEIIGDKGDIAYIRALLAAKANPDLPLLEKMKLDIASESKEEEDAIEQMQAKYTSPVASSLGIKISMRSERKINHMEIEYGALRFAQGSTPLHMAVEIHYFEAINLLLEHHAKSTLRNKQNFTPFGIAMERTPVSKQVVETFLKRGHEIDERNGLDQTTGLYLNCERDNLEGVKLLLQLKANPCARHKIQVLIGGKLSPEIVTPLSVAANKGLIPIVRELLKYNIPAKEIRRAIPSANNQACHEILRQACYQTYNREAIQAYQVQDFEKAERLYEFAIGYTLSGDERHLICYNLGVCLLEAHKLQDAHNALSECFAIRMELFPRDRDKMGPLLQQAQKKIEEISKLLGKSEMSVTNTFI